MGTAGWQLRCCASSRHWGATSMRSQQLEILDVLLSDSAFPDPKHVVVPMTPVRSIHWTCQPQTPKPPNPNWNLAMPSAMRVPNWFKPKHGVLSLESTTLNSPNGDVLKALPAVFMVPPGSCHRSLGVLPVQSLYVDPGRARVEKTAKVPVLTATIRYCSRSQATGTDKSHTGTEAFCVCLFVPHIMVWGFCF